MRYTNMNIYKLDFKFTNMNIYQYTNMNINPKKIT